MKMKLNCNNENTSNEFCIHTPVITCWSNQLDKIKTICLKYIPDCKELEDELSEIQKQCLTEIKGILLVNYKNMKSPIVSLNIKILDIYRINIRLFDINLNNEILLIKDNNIKYFVLFFFLGEF